MAEPMEPRMLRLFPFKKQYFRFRYIEGFEHQQISRYFDKLFELLNECNPGYNLKAATKYDWECCGKEWAKDWPQVTFRRGGDRSLAYPADIVDNGLWVENGWLQDPELMAAHQRNGLSMSFVCMPAYQGTPFNVTDEPQIGYLFQGQDPSVYDLQFIPPMEKQTLNCLVPHLQPLFLPRNSLQ